jgi:hypothetical protein
MSYLKFGGDCACGGKIKTHVKKPTQMEPTNTKVTCHDCGTRFMVQAYVEKGSSPRKYMHDIEILNLSEKAREIVKKKLEESKYAS